MIDTGFLILGLVFSAIGLGYFIYGRRHSNMVAKYCGIALMACPSFIDSKYAVLIIGAALMALPKFIEL